MKKFVLLCSKKWNYNNFGSIYDAICFKKNENNKYDFKQYTAEGFAGISAFKGKSSLTDIDLMTNSFNDEVDFLTNLKIYDPIYSMFIGYNTSGYVNKISPVFGNVQLINTIEKNVVNDKVKPEEVSRMFTKLFNEKGLFNLYMSSEYFKTNTFAFYLSEYKRILTCVKRGIEGDNTGDLLYFESKIKDNLSKYHLYRELFRASLDLENIKLKKEQAKQISESAPSNVLKKAFVQDVEQPKVKQLTLPGFEAIE